MILFADWLDAFVGVGGIVGTLGLICAAAAWLCDRLERRWPRQ